MGHDFNGAGASNGGLRSHPRTNSRGLRWGLPLAALPRSPPQDLFTPESRHQCGIHMS